MACVICGRGRSSNVFRTFRNHEEVIAPDLTALQDQLERPRLAVREMDLAQRRSRLQACLPRERNNSKLLHSMRAGIATTQNDTINGCRR
jgi:hypothetical protein